MSRLTSVRFCRTFSTLLSSGMTMLQSLAIVMKVVSNSAVETELEMVSEDIRKGFSLAQALRRVTYFPPMLQTMVAIGEESGSLDQMLENASGYLNDELENNIAKLISLIEPVMIVLMAGIVTFIILSVMLPMVQIYQSI
jgi:type IV pilus assembly protein PilC